MLETTDEFDASVFAEEYKFQQKAVDFQETYHNMLKKYQILLMKESTVNSLIF